MKLTVNDELLYETATPVGYIVIEAPTGYQTININPLWTELNIRVVPQPMEHSPRDYMDSSAYVPPRLVTEEVVKVLSAATTTNELTADEDYVPLAAQLAEVLAKPEEADELVADLLEETEETKPEETEETKPEPISLSDLAASLKAK